MKNRTQRIKQALTITFVAGMIAGGIMGSIGGYLIGAGKLHIELPEIPVSQECEWEECNCYDYDSWGNKVYNDYHYHCTVHGNGHECYGIDY